MEDSNNGASHVTVDQALDQIQNWITEGNTAMASEGLKEVLEMEPMNERALVMQKQLENVSTTQDVTVSSMPATAETMPTMASEPAVSDDIQIGGLTSQPTPVVEPIMPTETTEPVTPVTSVPPSFDIPAVPAEPVEPVETVEQPMMEAPAPAFSAPASSPFEQPAEQPTEQIAEPAVTPNVMPAEPQPAPLNSTDKKALIMKSLIPLGIALVLGFVVYFSYGFFGSKATPEAEKTVQTDIITQPEAPTIVEPEIVEPTFEEPTFEEPTSTEDPFANYNELFGDTTEEPTTDNTDSEPKVKVKRPTKNAAENMTEEEL